MEEKTVVPSTGEGVDPETFRRVWQRVMPDQTGSPLEVEVSPATGAQKVPLGAMGAIGCHWVPWCPMVSHWVPWCPIVSHWVPLGPMLSHWVPWFPIVFHWVP